MTLVDDSLESAW